MSRKLPYLPELDGVRAVAVLFVLWDHFPYLAGSRTSEIFSKIGHVVQIGYFGVNLFFVLSGFLITRILLEERARTGAISLRFFYARRALRIFPVYYLCVAIYALVYSRGDGDLLSLATYTVNFYEPSHPKPMALEHAWSLSVEEQFYLVWPLLIAVIPRDWGKILTGYAVPALSFLTALLIAESYESTYAANIIYMFSPTQMMSLSLGAYLAFGEANGDSFGSQRWVIVFGAGAALLGFDGMGRWLNLIPAGGFYWSGALVGYAMLSFGTIAPFVGVENRVTALAKSFLRLPPLRYLGRISYGIYLYHYIILFLLNLAPYQTEHAGAPFDRTAVAFVATMAVSALSFHYFETPLLRLKDRLFPASANTETAIGVKRSAA